MTTPTALITGASTGIGVSLARQLASKGYNLILMARRIELLTELKETLSKQCGGIQILVVQSDVANFDKHMQDVKSACSQFSTLNIAIANAGVGGTTNEWENAWERNREIISTNLLGAIATLEVCKDIMLKQGFGKLVGITSVASVRGFPQSSAYCASKAGFEKWMESVRMDLVYRGVTVTAIHPGFIETPMTAKNGRMPWLMGPDTAAEKILRAVERGKARFFFPWQMCVVTTLLRLMPNWLFDAIMRSGRRKISGFRKEHEKDAA